MPGNQRKIGGRSRSLQQDPDARRHDFRASRPRPPRLLGGGASLQSERLLAGVIPFASTCPGDPASRRKTPPARTKGTAVFKFPRQGREARPLGDRRWGRDAGTPVGEDTSPPKFFVRNNGQIRKG